MPFYNLSYLDPMQYILINNNIIYINNVPNGSIPFISSAMGQNFKDFRGLIPGIMGNLSVLNPFDITQAFMAGSNPDCKNIKLETIDNNNQKSSESHYLTLVDIQNQKLTESFTSGIADNAEEIKLPNDPITQIYSYTTIQTRKSDLLIRLHWFRATH